jgi:hypothetical protein
MQQINLYQPVLRKKRNQFAAPKLMQYALLVAGALVVTSGVQWWQSASAKRALADLKQQQQQLLTQVQTISTELSAMSDDALIKASITQKEHELINKQNVLQVLSGKDFGNSTGFAEHFSGLARQHIDGLWLTGLHIHSGGTRLNLSGSTYAPENVPRYLQNLAQEPGFRGLEFKTFLLERKDKSPLVNFDIRSQQGEPG